MYAMHTLFGPVGGVATTNLAAPRGIRLKRARFRSGTLVQKPNPSVWSFGSREQVIVNRSHDFPCIYINLHL